MAQRERDRPMTEEEIEDVAEAADELGERMVEALAEETSRDPDEFDTDIDSDDYEFPDPDA
jgi:ATP-dependent protease ClpP protease subunit